MSVWRSWMVFFALLCGGLASASAQPGYVGRYDVYTGWADLNAPDLGLNQNGVNVQVGVNPKRWYSVGFDYTEGTGSELLRANLLPAALQAQVAVAQALYTALGLLPANYSLAVPTDAFTQTFAMGPQLALRQYSRVDFFVRPALGALREHVVPHPTDAFSTVIVQGLAPAGFKQDWTGFYGAGGGGNIKVTKHMAVRVQFDAVYNHPFNDILANGRWTFRTSIGPDFHFGRNVPR